MVLYVMPYFVVHEHHSKKLHYDLRLEIDGALKSWAVPKGPSMSPQDKRLAIIVEDHPFEYGTFEGIIPEGCYGAGPVVIWDAGGFELLNKDMTEGRIGFFLKGKKLKGAFVLTRLKGKDKEWLLIKKKDEFAVPAFVVEPELTEKKMKTLEEKFPPCNIDEG